MNTTYSKSVQQQTDDFRLIQSASKQLEDIVAESADTVSAHWDMQPNDNGRPIYVLTLKDITEEVSGKIGQDELRSPNLRSVRLYLLWGNLIHAVNRKRIDRMVHAGD